MPDSPAGLGAAEGDVLLMVGTTKGAFLMRARPGERADVAAWQADGPHFPGEDVESWTLLRDGLPPVVCVKAAVVGAA